MIISKAEQQLQSSVWNYFITDLNRDNKAFLDMKRRSWTKITVESISEISARASGQASFPDSKV